MKPKVYLPVLGLAMVAAIYLGFEIGRRTSGGGNGRASPEHSTASGSGLTQFNSGMSAKERWAARMAARATEEMRDQGLLAAKKGLMYTTVGDDGLVSDAALREAKIPLSSRAEVQTRIDALWQDMSSALAQRIQADERRNTPGGTVRYYRVSADPEHGEASLEKFRAAVAARFGKASAGVLIDGMGKQFARFGRSDIRISFADVRDNDGRREQEVTYELVDPNSGKGVGGGSFVEASQLRAIFGSGFDQVEPSGNVSK